MAAMEPLYRLVAVGLDALIAIVIIALAVWPFMLLANWLENRKRAKLGLAPLPAVAPEDTETSSDQLPE